MGDRSRLERGGKNPRSRNTKKARNLQKRFKETSDQGVGMLSYDHVKEPMPPRFRTTFEIDYTGYLTASVASAMVTAVGLNKLYQPGTVSVTGTTVIGVSPWNLDSGYSATTNPQGYSNLMYNASTTGGVYTYYKVRKAMAQFMVYPCALADNLLATILPFIGNNLPTSFTAAEADRFAVNGGFSASQSDIGKRLTCTIMPHLLHGVSRKAWDEDESGEFGSMAPSSGPSLPSNFVIWVLTSSGANLANQCSFRLRIRYWVELGGLVATHETVS